MTETIRANILKEYRLTDANENKQLHSEIENIRNVEDEELKATYSMARSNKIRESIKTNNMILATLIDGYAVVFELDVEANGTSWNVESQWGDDGKLLYFELSNPIKINEQVNV